MELLYITAFGFPPDYLALSVGMCTLLHTFSSIAAGSHTNGNPGDGEHKLTGE